MSQIDESAWKCAGCGIASPNCIRACDCPTDCLTQSGVKRAVLKVETLEPKPDAWKWALRSQDGKGAGVYVTENYPADPEAFAITPLYAPQPLLDAPRVKALVQELRELNSTAVDENGHRWSNSDLIDQTCMEILSALQSDGEGQ